MKFDYSNIPRCPGVYRIFYEEKSYIGATFNLKSRLQKHLSYLKNNTHSNKYLQSVYNKHTISIEILKTFEDIDRDTLLDYETYYHIKYDSVENGFNIDLPRKIQSKFTLLQEQKDKAAKTFMKAIIMFDRYTGELQEEFSSITDAAKFVNGTTSNISKVCKGKLNHMYGHVFCFRIDYDKNKNYSYPNNHKKGKSHSLEHIKNLKLNHAKSKKVYKYDKNILIETYNSVRECEKVNNIKLDTLRYKLDKETPFGGYYYYTKIKDIV